MDSGQLVKASITNLDTSERIEFEFNPTEYSISKTNTWAASSTIGTNVGELQFSGGNPIEMTMSLIFDTSLSGGDVQGTYTSKLWKLAMVNEQNRDATTQRGRPPRCEFRWGGNWSFQAVITSISEKLTLFLADGTPIRSEVSVTLKQAHDEGEFPFQNPTSGGAVGHRSHIVRQRETLDGIAAAEYGQARHWRYIANVNHIDNPLAIRPGRVLRLPPLPEE
jgi:hypothetical protein